MRTVKVVTTKPATLRREFGIAGWSESERERYAEHGVSARLTFAIDALPDEILMAAHNIPGVRSCSVSAVRS